MSRMLRWIRDGEPLDDNTRIVAVWAHEQRPDYGTTSATRWILVELVSQPPAEDPQADREKVT